MNECRLESTKVEEKVITIIKLAGCGSLQPSRIESAAPWWGHQSITEYTSTSTKSTVRPYLSSHYVEDYSIHIFSNHFKMS